MRDFLMVITSLLLFSCSNVDLAPIYEKKTTPTHQATRALGPIYENLRLDNGHVRRAIRPIWSYERQGDSVAEDFVWPLSMSRLESDYYRANFLLFFYHNMNIKDERSDYLFWFFPLWFQGRDREKQDYFGLFPIWGSVHDAFGYDYLKFRFFPLRLQSKKSEVYSQSWLWPIYSKTSGPKVKKWRFWPFYGESVETERSQSSFIMWPFWHEGQSLVPEKTGRWYFFFPFYGKYEYDGTEKTTVLWPFFSWTKSAKEEALSAPWPFYTKRETKDGQEEKFTAWPFYASYKRPGKVTKQYAWPIGTYSRLGDEKTYEERSWWLPLYWSAKLVKEGVVQEDYKRFWPFYSKTINGDKVSVNILSLWPQRHMPAIERNWQTLWEPYNYYRDKDKLSHDVLWGFIKYKAVSDKKTAHFSVFPFYEKSKEQGYSKWSLLKGIIGRQELAAGKSRYRLLWLITFEVNDR